MSHLPSAVLDMLEQARRQGHDRLLEVDSLRIAAALGIAVPRHVVVTGPDDPLDLAILGGDRVVVKTLAPGLAHKTESGAVAVVATHEPTVRTTIQRMSERIPDASGFLVVEYVEHDASPGGEFLLGLRHTAAFGPVLTFGFGGTSVHLLADLGPDRVTTIMSPLLRDRAWPALVQSVAAGPLLDGIRGGPPLADGALLRRLIDASLDLAASTIPDHMLEFEINPLVFVDGAPVALDAVCRLGPAPAAAPSRPELPDGSLAALLQPRSMAIVGVSRGMNPGRVILRNVLDAGFPAEHLVVVKPGTDAIDGVRCVASLEEMGTVDALVVAVGADDAVDLVHDALAGSAARSIILIPGGIGERDGTADAATALAAGLASAPHPRPIVNGPNCMGIRSVPGRYDTTFIPDHKLGAPARSGRHPVALVSASGAFTLARHDRLGWLDPRLVITVGNQIDVTIGDHVAHLADDPEVRVVACYIEGFRPGDGARWAIAADRIRRRGGRLVVYLGGRTTEGADAAASHTAAVAGDGRVATALARAAGALVAETLEDFEDLLRIAVLLDDAPVAGSRLGAVTNAGFEAVAVADVLGGLELAEPTSGTLERLAEILRQGGVSGMVAPRNPLDLTPSCGAEAYVEAVAALLDDPGVDIGLVGCVPYTPSLDTLPPGPGHDEDVASATSLASRLIRLRAESDTPWVAVVDAGTLYDPMVGMLEDAGIPTFRRADRAVRAIAAWVGVG